MPRDLPLPPQQESAISVTTISTRESKRQYCKLPMVGKFKEKLATLIIDSSKQPKNTIVDPGRDDGLTRKKIYKKINANIKSCKSVSSRTYIMLRFFFILCDPLWFEPKDITFTTANIYYYTLKSSCPFFSVPLPALCSRRHAAFPVKYSFFGEVNIEIVVVPRTRMIVQERAPYTYLLQDMSNSWSIRFQ